jgi:hypothetical protein
MTKVTERSFPMQKTIARADTGIDHWTTDIRLNAVGTDCLFTITWHRMPNSKKSKLLPVVHTMPVSKVFVILMEKNVTDKVIISKRVESCSYIGK